MSSASPFPLSLCEAHTHLYHNLLPFLMHMHSKACNLPLRPHTECIRARTKTHTHTHSWQVLVFAIWKQTLTSQPHEYSSVKVATTRKSARTESPPPQPLFISPITDHMYKHTVTHVQDLWEGFVSSESTF